MGGMISTTIQVKENGNYPDDFGAEYGDLEGTVIVTQLVLLVGSLYQRVVQIKHYRYT